MLVNDRWKLIQIKDRCYGSTRCNRRHGCNNSGTAMQPANLHQFLRFLRRASLSTTTQVNPSGTASVVTVSTMMRVVMVRDEYVMKWEPAHGSPLCLCRCAVQLDRYLEAGRRGASAARGGAGAVHLRSPRCTRAAFRKRAGPGWRKPRARSRIRGIGGQAWRTSVQMPGEMRELLGSLFRGRRRRFPAGSARRFDRARGDEHDFPAWQRGESHGNGQCCGPAGTYA